MWTKYRHGYRQNNNNWKGGRRLHTNGYIVVKVDAGSRLDIGFGYAYEHRVVAEANLGREMVKGEHVHHIDGDKTNNDPQNIEVLTAAQHRYQHRSEKSKARLRKPGEANSEIECKCSCGAKFLKYDEASRPREYVPGHNRPPSPTQDKVLASMGDVEIHRSEIEKTTGLSLSLIGTTLYKLKLSGMVENPSLGKWRRSK